jgi:O-antigen ligase
MTERGLSRIDISLTVSYLGFSTMFVLDWYSYDVTQTADRAFLGKVVSWGTLVTTIFVLPGAAFDPINTPKLFALTLFAGLGFGVIAINLKHLKSGFSKPLTILAVLLVFNLFVIYLVSSADYYESFFGTFGRSTGLLAYLSLTLLMIAGAFAASNVSLGYVVKSLLVAGVVSSIYGLIQILDQEFLSWSNPYGPVIGFLGNPNFQSSFIGFVGILSFGYLLNLKADLKMRVAFLTLFLLSFFVIIKTTSQQGLIVLALGVGIVSVYRINFSKFRKVIPVLFGLGGITLVSAIFGMLNKGPLASLLYGPTLTYRGDYWLAGWNMTLQQPLFGVGLDNYGEWYRRTRSLEATLRRGPDVTSNAAHNVLLDLSSNGGFPLLIIYLSIMGLALWSAFRVLKRQSNSKFDPAFISIFAVWVAYHAQSVISINQIGLAIWGWAITGLIIGYELRTRDSTEDPISNIKSSRAKAVLRSSPQVSPRTVIGGFLGLLIGLIASLPALTSTVSYRNALVSGSLESIVEKTTSWPANQAHYLQTAQVFRDNKFEQQALEIAEIAVQRYPDSFKAWELLYLIESAPVSSKSEALAQMKRLDPLNPNLK